MQSGWFFQHLWARIKNPNHAIAEWIFTAHLVYWISICSMVTLKDTSSMQRTKEVEIFAPINNTMSWHHLSLPRKSKRWFFDESKASLKVACRDGEFQMLSVGEVKINYPRPWDVSCWNPTLNAIFSMALKGITVHAKTLGRIPRREQTDFDTKFVGTI